MKAAATKDTLITLQVDAWLLLEAEQRSHSAGRTDDEHSRGDEQTEPIGHLTN